MNAKQRAWDILEVTECKTSGKLVYDAVDVTLLSLILLNVVAVIVGTVQGVQEQYGDFLNAFETFSVVIFTIEYVVRVWACTVDPRYSHPVWGRLRYVFSPMALVDLAAFLPFYLSFIHADLRFLRTFRLFSIFRVLKLTRYFESLQLLGRVIRSRAAELWITLGVMGILLVIAASMIYYAEHDTQPEAYPDIPSSMWWSVVTLTTVGYGDVYPKSPVGKCLGAVVATLGIGLFALPTAILGTGFLEEIQKRHKSRKPRCCPHCGEKLPEDDDESEENERQ
jgi:voltage-gated potassium channel